MAKKVKSLRVPMPLPPTSTQTQALGRTCEVHTPEGKDCVSLLTLCR